MRGDEIEKKLEGLIDDPDDLQEALEEVDQMSETEKAHLSVEAARPSTGSDKVEMVMFGLILGSIVLAAFVIAFFSMRKLSGRVKLFQGEAVLEEVQINTFEHSQANFSFSYLSDHIVTDTQKGWLEIHPLVSEEESNLKVTDSSTDVIVIKSQTNRYGDINQQVEELVLEYCNTAKNISGTNCGPHISGIRSFTTETNQEGFQARLNRTGRSDAGDRINQELAIYYFELENPEYVAVAFVSTNQEFNQATQNTASTFKHN